ncbi:hypothetical protein FB45DRAFT_944548, partial [Roridomyces roridus]
TRRTIKTSPITLPTSLHQPTLPPAIIWSGPTCKVTPTFLRPSWSWAATMPARGSRPRQGCSRSRFHAVPPTMTWSTTTRKVTGATASTRPARPHCISLPISRGYERFISKDRRRLVLPPALTRIVPTREPAATFLRVRCPWVATATHRTPLRTRHLRSPLLSRKVINVLRKRQSLPPPVPPTLISILRSTHPWASAGPSFWRATKDTKDLSGRHRRGYLCPDPRLSPSLLLHSHPSRHRLRAKINFFSVWRTDTTTDTILLPDLS